MTTAEFIIGHSADDADDRKQEMRKVFWALLAAVAIHLLIGYSLAVYGGLLYSPFTVAEEDKPVELSFVDLSAPTPVPDELRLAELHPSKQSPLPPKEKTFQANINAVAASEQPAAGTQPVPSQDGKNRPFVSLDNQPLLDPKRGEQARPVQEEQERPQPPQQAMTPVPSKSQAAELAMLTSTPQPKVQPSVQPKPAQDLERYKRKTRVTGNISNRGPASVNAIATPLGRYSKVLYDAIGSRFQAYYAQKVDLVSLGSVELHFIVERSGKIKDLRVVKNSSNETLANICLQAVLEAQFPPIPEDLAENLPPEGLEWEPTFTIFPD